MEITSPGGTAEKIRYAVMYGADAVYTAYEKFGLRAAAGNLQKEEIIQSLQFCHERGSKLYLTLNIYPQDAEFAEIVEFIRWLAGTGIDAVIVSDPGVFTAVRENSDIPIHISTQANVTNSHTARFWYNQGAKRIIPARELSFQELMKIKDAVPELEVETFIHGAMCISWSGRCLLSAVLNKRSANQGECTHPCRWKWALTEESRPGEYFPVVQDQYGTYIMSSKDICLLNRMPQMLSAGINAGKIEGRMKSLYYVSQLTRIYKRATQTPISDADAWLALNDEARKVSHREYFEGFWDNTGSDIPANTTPKAGYTQDWQYCGKVIAQTNKEMHFVCTAKMQPNDVIEVINPDMSRDFCMTCADIYNEDGEAVDFTRADRIYRMSTPSSPMEGALLRKRV